MKVLIKVPLKKEWQMTIDSKSHIKRGTRKSFLKRILKKILASSINPGIHLKVDYGYQNYNEGNYTTIGEFKRAYSAFTDPKLINYLRNWR